MSPVIFKYVVYEFLFSPNGKENIYTIVDKYLDYAIQYDQPFVVTKYNIQQHLGGDQVSIFRHLSNTGRLLIIWFREKEEG